MPLRKSYGVLRWNYIVFAAVENQRRLPEARVCFIFAGVFDKAVMKLMDLPVAVMFDGQLAGFFPAHHGFGSETAPPPCDEVERRSHHDEAFHVLVTRSI